MLVVGYDWVMVAASILVAILASFTGLRLVSGLRNGDDFAQVAIANSASSRALEGGDLGWRRAGELPSLFAEQVLEMEIG